MNEVRSIIRKKVKDKLVIYQGRKDYVKGHKKCLISLLKPVVSPDGKLYPCCGVQYALINTSKDYEKSMCMGDAKDIDKLYKEQKCFDGRFCVRCYYSSYNHALNILVSELQHGEFI